MPPGGANRRVNLPVRWRPDPTSAARHVTLSDAALMRVRRRSSQHSLQVGGALVPFLCRQRGFSDV